MSVINEKDNKSIEFDDTKFPEVKIKFNYVNNDDEYNKFEDYWLGLYKRNKNFYFIFDTTNIYTSSLKYAFKLVSFIKFIKENIKVQYLTFSIIIVGNVFIKNILNLIFKISKPVAPVYIVNNIDYYSSISNDIINNKLNNDNILFVDSK